MRGLPIGFGAAGVLLLAAVAPHACGGTLGNDRSLHGEGGRDSPDGRSGESDGSVAGEGNGEEGEGDSGDRVVATDALLPPMMDSAPDTPPCATASGPVSTPDCPGCPFPCANAPSCSPSAPAIQVVYPADAVLVPPNLNTISVQWTPYGAPFTRFSVDFSSPPNLDWHIVTACKNQTVDAQSGNPSGGCELVVDPVSWSKLVGTSRGQGPVTIAVRGTTDGICASASTNSVHMSFAEEDVLGTYYYWKSNASGGAGGQIGRSTSVTSTRPSKM
jgi:hypothetical protein